MHHETSLYSIIDGLLFQHQLFHTQDSNHVLTTVYFDTDSLSTLRGTMYAAKYFDKNNGVFKLVFYPAMGQTTPPK